MLRSPRPHAGGFMAEALSGRHRHTVAALVVALALAAVASAPADARPPNLGTVGATGGIVTANWSLPPNVSSEFVEVGKYLEVNAYGYFQCFRAPRPTLCEEGESNIVRFGILSSDQTSLIANDVKPPLPAGTYYVHIAGHDAVHTACPQIEFSDVVELTIGPDGTETSSKVVAPGTGECTLIRGAGGTAGGGGGGGGGVPGDETAPVAQLRFSKRQDIDKLAIRARMSEPGTLTAKALVDVGGLLAKIYTFRPKTRKVSGGLLTKLPLKVSKKKKRALKRAMRRGKRLRARITLTAVDRAGNTTTKHAIIRLKP
jgi:hypothetical protein